MNTWLLVVSIYFGSQSGAVITADNLVSRDECLRLGQLIQESEARATSERMVLTSYSNVYNAMRVSCYESVKCTPQTCTSSQKGK